VLCLLTPLVAIAAIDADYRVVDVDRRESFAGRLGRRVEQTLTVERDGKRYEIRVGRAHTGIRGSVRSFSAGDTVRPDWGYRVSQVR